MKIIFISLLILILLPGYGQTLTVSGTVKDIADNTLLSGATVRLNATTDTTMRNLTLSDKLGQFSLNVYPGAYRLQISSVGYLTSDTLILVVDSARSLGTIGLFKRVKMLEEVVIKATSPPVRQKGDTLEYSSNAFKVNPDANAEDLVRKMPGITVDQGVVKAGGEDVKKVTVDGREFFGEDATAALKNLPAEIIDKIQVFDRLSEQAQLTGFEDENTAKGINIVTKANMRNGQFGRVFAGYGTDNRYSAGGNVSFFNGNRRISLVGLSNNINQQNFSTEDLLGVTSSNNNRSGGGQGGQRGGQRGSGGSQSTGGRGFGSTGNFLVGQQAGISQTNALGINYSDLWGRKVTVSGSYFYNNSDNSANSTLNRQYFTGGDSSQFYNQKSISALHNENHRFNMRMEYKIDSFNTLIFTPSISFQKSNSFNSLTGENTLKGNQVINRTDNFNQSSNSGYNLNNSILFRHSFAKRGRSLSLNLTTGYNNRTGNTYLDAFNQSFGNSGNSDDSLRQFTDRISDGYQLSANISYTEPLGKKGQLQFNYRPSYSMNHSDQQTFQFASDENKYSLFDTSLSNKFDNNYTTQNGGVNYRYNNKKTQFALGLAYQGADLSSEQIFPFATTINRSFSNILPNAMWNSKFSAKSSLRLSYRTSTSAPSIAQLQDVINNNNPILLTTGNPDLRQQYTHNMIARYTYTNTSNGMSFLGNIFMQKTDDYIANATIIPASDTVLSNSTVLLKGGQLMKPVNLNGYWNIRSFFTFGMPLKFIKSNLNWNAGYSYSKIPGIINSITNSSANQTYNAGAVLASNISQYIDFNISYSGNFSQVHNSIQPELNTNYFSQAAGAQINLLSKSGWVFQNDLSNQSYRGLTDGYNQNFWLWNMSIGKKFLKGQNGELKLSVFDLLKQNQSISRNVEETYIEDVQTQVLQQYFMLTFTYKLRNFGGKK